MAGLDNREAMQMRVKVLTIVFVVFLIGVVIVANLGLGPVVFRFLKYIPGGDKAGHFVLMGLLSLLVNLSFGAQRVTVGGLPLLKGSLIVMAVVTVEELSQLLLKHRGFDLLDLAMDYLGIVAFGVLAEHLVQHRRVAKSS